jgi:PAS domain S-box-containing protein
MARSLATPDLIRANRISQINHRGRFNSLSFRIHLPSPFSPAHAQSVMAPERSPSKLRWRWVALSLIAMTVLVLVSSAIALRHLEDLLSSPSNDMDVEDVRRVGWRLLIAQAALLLGLAVVIFWAVRVQRRQSRRVVDAQGLLRANEELFRVISENVTDLITVSDIDGRWLYVSSSCARFLGPPETLLGHDSFEPIHPEDRPRVMRVYREIAQTGVEGRARYRLFARDGLTYTIESAGSVVRDAAGVVEKIVVVSRDITERQRNEDTLRLTMERFERQNAAIADHAHSPEMISAEPRAAYQRVTATAARTLDVARVSVWFFTENLGAIRCVDLYDLKSGRHSSGTELQSSTYPKYFASLTEGRSIAAHHAQLDPRTAEFARDYLRPLGITSMLDAPLRQAGRLVGVICHEHIGEARDWTPDEEAFAASMADMLSLSLEIWHHRETEAALCEARDSLEAKVTQRTSELAAANAQLKELDRLKSEFIATMSHELRTPLNSIIGFTGILRQRIAGPLNDEQDKQLGMVQRAARHLLGLINDILDLSRIESGHMELDAERFRVADVAREVVEQLTPLALPKGIDLHATLPAPEIEICSDRKKCVQILLNLAANAVKFTQRGHVGLAVHPENDGVSIAVTDSGIGIKPEHLPNLFQAFRQVDGTARRVYEGTGLGLYLCKKLAALLGGDIRAESTFGVGSCFTVTLPSKFSSTS